MPYLEKRLCISALHKVHKQYECQYAIAHSPSRASSPAESMWALQLLYTSTRHSATNTTTHKLIPQEQSKPGDPHRERRPRALTGEVTSLQAVARGACAAPRPSMVRPTRCLPYQLRSETQITAEYRRSGAENAQFSVSDCVRACVWFVFVCVLRGARVVVRWGHQPLAHALRGRLNKIYKFLFY